MSGNPVGSVRGLDVFTVSGVVVSFPPSRVRAGTRWSANDTARGRGRGRWLIMRCRSPIPVSVPGLGVLVVFGAAVSFGPAVGEAEEDITTVQAVLALE